MIKRLWLTIKFLFIGKVDGYISEHEALEMRVATANYWEKYSERFINEAVDDFWKSLSQSALKDIGLIHIKKIDARIKSLIDCDKNLIPIKYRLSDELQSFYSKQIDELKSIKNKLQHDIELLG